MNTSSINRFFFVVLFVPIFLFSCSDDDEINPSTTDDNSSTDVSEYANINNWILDNMNYYYYWKDQLPENPGTTLSPDSFFESLLYTFNASSNPNGDRFSYISEDADELISSLSGESTSTGMEFRLFYRANSGNEVLAQIIYTIPDSPADQAGLERGDMFTKVNGTTITDQNYIDLLYNTSSMTISLAEYQNSEIVDTDETVSLNATVVQENPIYLDTILEVNGQKIAYLVYNQFIPAPNDSEGNEYDEQLNQIFTEFKAAGATELIVDLRYNPGGYVSSAVTLASLIGTGVNSNEIFFTEEYNDELHEELQAYYGPEYFNQNFENLSGNIGTQLSRVYFLVTDNSASSSELVINGLLPYMNVYLIGETTYGKNVGSITITDDANNYNHWALQPIVMKAYNSLGNSDYSAGFIPDIEVSENSELVPFGNTADPLLGAALGAISGSARFGIPSEAETPRIVGNSVSRKKVTFKKISAEALN